jgi:hypothetical protein
MLLYKVMKLRQWAMDSFPPNFKIRLRHSGKQIIIEHNCGFSWLLGTNTLENLSECCGAKIRDSISSAKVVGQKVVSTTPREIIYCSKCKQAVEFKSRPEHRWNFRSSEITKLLCNRMADAVAIVDACSLELFCQDRWQNYAPFQTESSFDFMSGQSGIEHHLD